MQFVADVFATAGALGAAIYCMILSHRLRSFTRLDRGMGAAIAALATQVDELTRTLDTARRQAGESTRRLSDLLAAAGREAERLDEAIAEARMSPALRRVAEPVRADHATPMTEPAPVNPATSEPATADPGNAYQPDPPVTSTTRRLRLVQRRTRQKAVA